jgi:uncharacterized protein YndB with AHSA1/START domain
MRLLLATIAVLATGAAGASVLDSSAAGFTVENTVVVPVKPDQAWTALVEKVDAWWPKDHSWFGKDGKFSIDARAGGCFCEAAGKRQAQHMTVSFVDPGRLLRMLGGLGPLQGLGLSGAMDWRLEPADAGTKITLHYVAGGYTSTDLVKFAPIVDQVQGQQLAALAAYLSKNKPSAAERLDLRPTSSPQ